MTRQYLGTLICMFAVIGIVCWIAFAGSRKKSDPGDGSLLIEGKTTFVTARKDSTQKITVDVFNATARPARIVGTDAC